jgi:hypothetical protein
MISNDMYLNNKSNGLYSGPTPGQMIMQVFMVVTNMSLLQ